MEPWELEGARWRTESGTRNGSAGAEPMSVDVGSVGADEGFEDGQNFFLLAAGQLGSGLEKLAHPAAWRKHALGPGFTQQFLDGDAEGFGDGHENIRTRDLPGSLPIADVGMVLADLAGQFA